MVSCSAVSPAGEAHIARGNGFGRVSRPDLDALVFALMKFPLVAMSGSVASFGDAALIGEKEAAWGF